MFLINYSQDILYISLAFAVLWVTAFLTWFLYYLIMAAKDFRQAVKSIKARVDDFESAVLNLKRRLSGIGSAAAVLGPVFKKLNDWLKSQEAKKGKRSKKGATKSDENDDFEVESF